MGNGGVSVHLDSPKGDSRYRLNVTPTGDLTGRSFDSTTSGANCVGTPCGNNQNAFFDSNFFGAFFTSTANFGQLYDFSMGVNGTVGGGGGGDLTLESSFSRKTDKHNTFDIPLPGVEDRSDRQALHNWFHVQQQRDRRRQRIHELRKTRQREC